MERGGKLGLEANGEGEGVYGRGTPVVMTRCGYTILRAEGPRLGQQSANKGRMLYPKT